MPLTAIVFPGQGASSPDLAERVTALVPELHARACERLGTDPIPRLGESTAYAQPAVFLGGMAGWRELRDGESPAAFSGHSIGELTALAAAGALGEEDALDLVIERGRLMAEAGAASPGGMIAILKLDPEAVAEIAAETGLTVANDNAPGQLVLAGSEEARAAATAIARERKGRAMDLGVTGAFHSPAMAPAIPAFAEALSNATFAEPSAPVWSCASAEPFVDPPTELAEALAKPVRWRETVLALEASGIDRLLDAGPGSVLQKMVRRITDTLDAVAASEVVGA